jgi:hypothetical protein
VRVDHTGTAPRGDVKEVMCCIKKPSVVVVVVVVVVVAAERCRGVSTTQRVPLTVYLVILL